jgi:predicted nucleic acid-binding protein
MVLVDSSIWIEAARREGDLMCKVALESLLDEMEAATCSPVLLEVLGGARKEERRSMGEYFEIIPHLPVGPKDWTRAIALGWQLRDKGHSVPWNDALIAATALNRDLRVYAKDKHFELMANNVGLALYRPGYGGTYSAEQGG